MPFAEPTYRTPAKIAQRVLWEEERRASKQSRERSKRLAKFAPPRRGEGKGITVYAMVLLKKI